MKIDNYSIYSCIFNFPVLAYISRDTVHCLCIVNSLNVQQFPQLHLTKANPMTIYPLLVVFALSTEPHKAG